MQHLALLAASCALQSLLCSKTPAPRASGGFPAIIFPSGGPGAPTLSCCTPLTACLQGERDAQLSREYTHGGSSKEEPDNTLAPTSSPLEANQGPGSQLCAVTTLPSPCPRARHTQRPPLVGQTPQAAPTGGTTQDSCRIFPLLSISFLLLVVFFLKDINQI